MVEDSNTQYTFKSYVWASKTDIIGAGATSLVYKAISTETGEYVAVKVFNEAAKARANVLQLRELDLLCKINHENVVKLIDKDDQVKLSFFICLNYQRSNYLCDLMLTFQVFFISRLVTFTR